MTINFDGFPILRDQLLLIFIEYQNYCRFVVSCNLQLHCFLWLGALFCCSFFCPLDQP